MRVDFNVPQECRQRSACKRLANSVGLELGAAWESFGALEFHVFTFKYWPFATMSCNFLMLFDATSPPRNLRREGQGRSHQDHQHSANWRCFAHHQEGRMIEVRFVSECFICFDSYTSFCSRLESELSFGLGLGEGCQVHCVGISPWPTWWKRRGSFEAALVCQWILMVGWGVNSATCS